MTRTTARLVRLAGGLLAGAVVLSGCSNASNVSDAVASSSASESADNAAFNDADVTFVQGMIPHHRGALTMAELADGRAEDPRVIDLASRIESAQEPEIETMTAWLEEWGEPLPEETMSEGSGGMDHGSGDMGSGMEGMSEEDMVALEGASGAEFDRMFLEMMIEHHQGAVEMAETEVEDGAYPDAIVLASEIADSQTAEIAEMETILSELGS